MAARLKVMFIVDRFEYLEKSSIPILSAIVKAAGHESSLIEFDRNRRKSLQCLRSHGPHILAYSTSSVDAARFLEINRLIRKSINALSVFGGPHPTFCPDFIQEEGVDAICVGEGDIAFREFLGNFGTDEVFNTPNFHFKTNNDKGIIRNGLAELVKDLDELPFPDRDIMYKSAYIMRNMPIRNFFAGRGCPFKCSYCFNHIFNGMYRGKGKILRVKSVDYLLKEIKGVIKRYPTEFIRFHDDIFAIDKEWLGEFAGRFPREIGLPFLCFVRPNVVSEDYCRLLKQAGCHSVAMAVECGSEEIRKRVLNRNMSDEKIMDAFRILKSNGIRFNSLNMLGLPDETEEDIRKTILINRRGRAVLGTGHSKSRIDFADASIFQPYPGLAITRYAGEKGLLNGGTAAWNNPHTDSCLNFSPEFREKIVLYHRLFGLLVDHEFLDSFFPALLRLHETIIGAFLIDKIHRLYYGYCLPKRIFPARIPARIRMYAAYRVIWGARFRN